MRWVVYALLALNLGLLTWNLQGRATSPDPETQAVTALVPPKEESDALPLLSELEQPGLRSRPARVAAAAPTPAAPASGAPAPESTPPASPPEPPVEPAAQTRTASAPAADPKPAEATPGPAETVAEAPSPEPVAAPPEPRSEARSCMTLGPLEDKTAISGIQAWLEERGAEVDVRTDERREVALYWVFLPPRASRAVAIGEVERMKEQGIQDIIVVPKGDMANAISLGVFSRPESRDRRLKELNGKGYQPSIGPRYRTKVATWVDVSVEAGALDSGAVEARWPGVRVTPGPCPGAPAQASSGAPSQASAGAAESAASESTPRASAAAAERTGSESTPKPPRFHFSGQASEQ